jgi:hypothetical protein
MLVRTRALGKPPSSVLPLSGCSLLILASVTSWMSESGGMLCRKRYVAAEPLQKHRARRVTCERW